MTVEASEMAAARCTLIVAARSMCSDCGTRFRRAASFKKMIVELTAENVAILDQAALSLGPGFTVLTGETGAGKSLLVDAIELALGARGDSELVR